MSSCGKVFSRIKSALEASESAKLARDAALRREMELSRELECLNGKLANARQEVEQQLQREHEGQMMALQQQLDEEHALSFRLKLEV